MSEPEPLVCRRCGRPVVTCAADYSTFEGMHYVCFHYEFEHELGSAADPDVDCGLPGCPSGPLPTKAVGPG